MRLGRKPSGRHWEDLEAGSSGGHDQIHCTNALSLITKKSKVLKRKE